VANSCKGGTLPQNLTLAPSSQTKRHQPQQALSITATVTLPSERPKFSGNENAMKKIKFRFLVQLICVLSISQQLLGAPAASQTIQVPSKNTKEQTLDSTEDNALASKLIQAFFASLSATGSPTGTIGKPLVDDSEARQEVKRLLDQDVVIQRADGDFFDYTSYYPTDIDEFTVSNVNTTKPRPDLIVATYDVSTPGATSLTRGFVNSADFTPRLTTFRYNPELKRWLILSHASYNQPIKQICNQPSILSTPDTKRSDGEPARTRLANTLIEKFYTDLQVHREAIAHQGGLITKNTQIMTADGYRQKTGNEGRSVQVGTTQKRGFFIAGSGNDLVVRYEAKTKGRIGGVEFTNEWQPRLATFSRNSKGEWELASFASFNYPASPPANMQCLNKHK
jgi:hypothetical protein